MRTDLKNFIVALVFIATLGGEALAEEVFLENHTLTIPDSAKLVNDQTDVDGNKIYLYEFEEKQSLIVTELPAAKEGITKAGRDSYHNRKITKLRELAGFISHETLATEPCLVDAYKYELTDELSAESNSVFAVEYIAYCSNSLTMVVYTSLDSNDFETFSESLSAMFSN